MHNLNHPTEVVLPPELEPLRDDSMHEIHAEWLAKSADDIRGAMPESRMHDSGITSLRYVELTPTDGEFDPEQTGLLPLPVAKTWESATYAWAEIVRQMAIPDGRLIVLPHNNFGAPAYSFTKAEQATVASGSLEPLAERYLRLCDALGIDSLELVAGRSFGAAAGAAFGSRALDHIQVKTLALDEAPNTFKNRSALALAHSLTRENGIASHVQEEAGLPAFSELVKGSSTLQSHVRLSRYIAGLLFAGPNPSINRMFRSDEFMNNIAAVVSEGELAGVSLSNATSSTVGDIEATAVLAEHLGANAYISNERIRHNVYSGYHVTAGNPFVMGVLVRDALRWYDQELSIADHDFNALGSVPTHSHENR